MGNSPPSIAVLAFEDLSPQKNQEYFCDGIAEEIINNLTRMEGIKVASRTSAFAYKNKPEDIRIIGKNLDVQTVLEGSVRKADDRLRITTQLIDVADGCHLWSQQFDRETADIFEIQVEIARNISQTLKIKLSDNIKHAIKKVPTENIAAYDFYLRGRQFFYRHKRQYMQHAIDMFARAIERDTAYAHAYVNAKWGKRKETEKLLKKIMEESEKIYISPTNLALIYDVLGDFDRGFSLLEKAYSERDNRLQFLKVDAWSDSFRSDPRFKTLLKRMNLD